MREEDWGLNVGYGLGEKVTAKRVGGGGSNVGHGTTDEGVMGIRTDETWV